MKNQIRKKRVSVIDSRAGLAINLESVWYAAKTGHVELLWRLKAVFGLTAKDARADDNYALSLAASNGHVGVLRFLKEEWGLTEEDARADNNYALRWAAYNGHVEVLRFLKDEFELTADDARADDNYALRNAAENGHVEVLRLLIDCFKVPLAKGFHEELIRLATEKNQYKVIDYLNTITIEPAKKYQKV